MKKSKVLSLLLCYSFEREFKKITNKFNIKIDEKEYPDEIFWFIDDKCYMFCKKYNCNEVYCRYNDFIKILKDKFIFNTFLYIILIKYLIEKYFNLKRVIPHLDSSHFIFVIPDDYFKNKKTLI